MLIHTTRTRPRREDNTTLHIKQNSQKSTTPFIHNNITRNDTKVPPQTYYLLKDIHDKFTTEKNRGAVKRHLAGSRTQKLYYLIKSASEYVTLASNQDLLMITIEHAISLLRSRRPAVLIVVGQLLVAARPIHLRRRGVLQIDVQVQRRQRPVVAHNVFTSGQQPLRQASPTVRRCDAEVAQVGAKLRLAVQHEEGRARKLTRQLSIDRPQGELRTRDHALGSTILQHEHKRGLHRDVENRFLQPPSKPPLQALGRESPTLLHWPRSLVQVCRQRITNISRFDTHKAVGSSWQFLSAGVEAFDEQRGDLAHVRCGWQPNSALGAEVPKVCRADG